MRRGRPRHDDVLTPREWQVLGLLREGLTNERIAERLDISHDTAKFHVSEILSKLGVQSRQEAAAWQGRPKVAFGLAPVAGLLAKLGGISPWKAAGAGAIGVAGIAFVLLALGVLMSNGGDSLGKIAFVRDGNIWVQDLPDGSPEQLTDQGNASRPAWSPSGEWLLYNIRDEDAEEPPGIQLWVIRSDGSDERLLTANGYSGYWQPEEGERVLYLTSDEETVAEDADGGGRETVFAPFEEDGETVRRIPHGWPSPDGKHELYWETREPLEEPIRGATAPDTTVWVAEADGSHPVHVATIDPQADRQVVPFGWSSDGSHVLLVETGDAVDGVPPPIPLLAVPVSGGEPEPVGLNVSLTHSGAEVGSGRLVVTGVAQESWTDKRIALIAPDASSYTLLTEPDVAAVEPAWSPDGGRIAYVAAPDLGQDAGVEVLAQRRLWAMAPDGSGKRQLTTGDGFRDESPMWAADGKSLLFARLPVDDFCNTSSYDLMRYSFEDRSVEALVEDLPLGSTFNAWSDAASGCEAFPSSTSGPITDFLGDLSLGHVLHWWQPQP